jgi:hypothetical protein
MHHYGGEKLATTAAAAWSHSGQVINLKICVLNACLQTQSKTDSGVKGM